MEDKPLIVGYTTSNHLLLDLDNTTYQKVRALSKLIIQHFPKVGDALIMQSNTPRNIPMKYPTPTIKPLDFQYVSSYHLIFNNIIPYDYSCEIIEILASLDVLNEDYVKIRKFRGDMTLRVSPAYLYNETKPVPMIKGYIKNNKNKGHDGMIWKYLRLLDIVTCFFNSGIIEQNY